MSARHSTRNRRFATHGRRSASRAGLFGPALRSLVAVASQWSIFSALSDRIPVRFLGWEPIKDLAPLFLSALPLWQTDRLRSRRGDRRGSLRATARWIVPSDRESRLGKGWWSFEAPVSVRNETTQRQASRKLSSRRCCRTRVRRHVARAAAVASLNK